MMTYTGDFLWSAYQWLVNIPGLVPAVMVAIAALFTRQAWKSLPVSSERPRTDIKYISLIMLFFGLFDWLLIASLPFLNISYGPLRRTLFMVLFARLFAFACLGLVWEVGRHFSPAFLATRGIRTGVLLLGVLNLVILAGELDALIIEPFRLQATQIALPELLPSSSKPLRILHISDLHVERATQREQKLLSLARRLKPDLILLTGDYVNVDYRDDMHTWQDTRSILGQLEAPYGVYAVTGTPGVETPANIEYIFSGLNIRLLQDEVEHLKINGQDIVLLGISNQGQSRDSQALMVAAEPIPEDAFSVLLYHTPDLIETAVQEGIDLYLAGHTHGGQVRLPFYGALVTFSAYGKEYESGLYRRGATTLFVSRGVGLEGLGLPRVRFLCPPEIALIEVGGNER